MTDLVPATPPLLAHQPDAVLPGTAERILSGIPDNTRRSYRVAFGTFTEWCAAAGRVPLPTTSATFADYVAHLCDLGKAPATILHRMAGVSVYNQMHGHPALDKETTKAAKLALRGYRKQRAVSTDGDRTQEAPPITRPRLRQMSAACDRNTLTGRRDRLLLVIGWALAGRRSELAALRIGDVRIVDGELEVYIRMSKTDQDAEGDAVNVPAGEHVDTDPVSLLAEWLEALAAHGIDTTRGYLFRAITKDDRPYRHGRITPDNINGVIKRAARRAGLPNASQYSAHSLRAGFATQASNDGIPMSIWARHGRWKETSPVPAKYVRVAERRRDNPLRKMGL